MTCSKKVKKRMRNTTKKNNSLVPSEQERVIWKDYDNKRKTRYLTPKT